MSYLADANPNLVYRKAWKRAALIYGLHLTVSAMAICLARFWPDLVSPFGREIEEAVSSPWMALGHSALFYPSAPLLDFLPMYVCFLLLTPWLLRRFQAGKLKLVFVSSFLLWLLTQTGISIPLPPFTLAFETAGWQFLFVTALYLGFRTFGSVWPRCLCAGNPFVVDREGEAGKNLHRHGAIFTTGFCLACLPVLCVHVAVSTAPALFDSWTGTCHLLCHCVPALPDVDCRELRFPRCPAESVKRNPSPVFRLASQMQRPWRPLGRKAQLHPQLIARLQNAGIFNCLGDEEGCRLK